MRKTITILLAALAWAMVAKGQEVTDNHLWENIVRYVSVENVLRAELHYFLLNQKIAELESRIKTQPPTPPQNEMLGLSYDTWLLILSGVSVAMLVCVLVLFIKKWKPSQGYKDLMAKYKELEDKFSDLQKKLNANYTRNNRDVAYPPQQQKQIAPQTHPEPQTSVAEITKTLPETSPKSAPIPQTQPTPKRTLYLGDVSDSVFWAATPAPEMDSCFELDAESGKFTVRPEMFDYIRKFRDTMLGVADIEGGGTANVVSVAPGTVRQTDNGGWEVTKKAKIKFV